MIINQYESYGSSIRMSHTDRRSVFNKRVNDILALSPVLLDVQQKCWMSKATALVLLLVPGLRFALECLQIVGMQPITQFL